MPQQTIKAPVQPFEAALEQVIETIDSCADGAAVFMCAGRVVCVKRSATSYASQVEKRVNRLVGVYDSGADYRWVRADLMEFYQGAQQ